MRAETMKKKIVLIAGMGNSPQVLTETVWELAHLKRPLVPDEIVVLAAKNTTAKLRKTLLEGDAPVWRELIASLKKEGVSVEGKLVFGSTHSDHMINGIRVAVKKGLVKPEDVNIAFFERKPHVVDEVTWTAKTENGLQKFVAPKGEWDHTEIYTEVHNIKIDENGSLSEYPTDFVANE